MIWLYCIYALLVIGLFISEVRGKDRAVIALKPAASLGFLIIAMTAGAFASPYSWFIFIGLIFSFIGDVALLKNGTGRAFLIGMGAFFFAHLAYLFGFIYLVEPGLFWIVVLIVSSISAVLTVRVFEKYLPENLSKPLYLYSFAISSMLTMAVYASVKMQQPIFAIAAALFVISDMAVGQHRFVSQNPKLFFMITPFYFLAQAIFAISIGLM